MFNVQWKEDNFNDYWITTEELMDRLNLTAEQLKIKAIEVLQSSKYENVYTITCVDVIREKIRPKKGRKPNKK